MAKSHVVGFVFAVALAGVLGNGAWILVLVNLFWLLFKGGILVSWSLIGTIMIAFVFLVIVHLALSFWAGD